jgi:hypothetical protein
MNPVLAAVQLLAQPSREILESHFPFLSLIKPILGRVPNYFVRKVKIN